MIPALFKCENWTKMKYPKLLIHCHVTFKGLELGLVIVGGLFSANFLYKKIKTLMNKNKEVTSLEEKTEKSNIITENTINTNKKERDYFKQEKILIFSALGTNILAFGKILTLEKDTLKKFAFRIYQNPRLHELDSYMMTGAVIGVIDKKEFKLKNTKKGLILGGCLGLLTAFFVKYVIPKEVYFIENAMSLVFSNKT